MVVSSKIRNRFIYQDTNSPDPRLFDDIEYAEQIKSTQAIVIQTLKELNAPALYRLDEINVVVSALVCGQVAHDRSAERTTRSQSKKMASSLRKKARALVNDLRRTDETVKLRILESCQAPVRSTQRISQFEAELKRFSIACRALSSQKVQAGAKRKQKLLSMVRYAVEIFEISFERKFRKSIELDSVRGNFAAVDAQLVFQIIKSIQKKATASEIQGCLRHIPPSSVEISSSEVR